MSENCITCSNCSQSIPESKILLHETYCIRFNIKCERCGYFYDKNDPDAHEEDYHKKEKCQYCYLDFDDLSKHKCSKTPKQCLYCDLNYTVDQIVQHENQCGSRTEKCDICQNYIMKRDLTNHYQSCFQKIDKIEQPIQKKPSIQDISQNANNDINIQEQLSNNLQKQQNLNQLQQQNKIKKQIAQLESLKTKLPSKEINFGQIQGQKISGHQISLENKQTQKIGLDQQFKNRPPSSLSQQGQKHNIIYKKSSTSQNRSIQQINNNKINQKLLKPSVVNTNQQNKQEKKIQVNNQKNSNLPPLAKQVQNPQKNFEKKNIVSDIRAQSVQSRLQAKRSSHNLAVKEQIEVEGFKFSDGEIRQQQLIFEQLKKQKSDSVNIQQRQETKQNSISKAKVTRQSSDVDGDDDFEQFMSPEERVMQQQIMDSYKLHLKKQ
ncbi:unnamed protein product [Paramecium sonneborni]|uniref:TRAFD1/XAF1 zinc finger domain-containing protein n=1 Tax=Paramecium sonneborni TaxID=65129 RepID=A0A8S1P5N9_9CILI|nr:unnamed protein product [Paramecium sonneborni]